jgi:HicB family
MHRTQLLLPPELHRRAAEAARARRMSLGNLVREALRDYLARTGEVQPSAEAVDEVLLGAPFEDPDPDPDLSANVDHYLYGAARRRRRRR